MCSLSLSSPSAFRRTGKQEELAGDVSVDHIWTRSQVTAPVSRTSSNSQCETGAVTSERVQIWSTATSPASSSCLPVRLNAEGEEREREHAWNPPVSEGE